MRNQGQLIIGSILVLLGLMFLISNLFDIRLGAFCWPSALILLGAWLLLRPRMVAPDTAVVYRIIGNIEREGAWQVSDEEIWSLIGNVELDMSEALIPAGETRIRIYGFAGDVKAIVPADVGVAVSSYAFAASTNVLGQKNDGVLSPVDVTSDNYKAADRRLRLEITFFAGDVKVRQTKLSSPVPA
jgi:lia operon protein LiaF